MLLCTCPAAAILVEHPLNPFLLLLLLLLLAVVLPGYEAQWNAAGSFAYAADECEFGTYWPGGAISGPTTCISCGGYTTAAVASKSKAACAAPPGYYLPTGATAMQLCPSSVTAAVYDINATFGTFGTYRSGWATTPNGLKDCQICGANVLSERTKENQHPTDSTVELVASSPDACCKLLRRVCPCCCDQCSNSVDSCSGGGVSKRLLQ
jgi:hypothetical protein